MDKIKAIGVTNFKQLLERSQKVNKKLDNVLSVLEGVRLSLLEKGNDNKLGMLVKENVHNGRLRT